MHALVDFSRTGYKSEEHWIINYWWALNLLARITVTFQHPFHAVEMQWFPSVWIRTTKVTVILQLTVNINDANAPGARSYKPIINFQVQKAFEVGDEFFNLPSSVKSNYLSQDRHVTYHGYISYGEER